MEIWALSNFSQFKNDNSLIDEVCFYPNAKFLLNNYLIEVVRAFFMHLI